MNNKRTIAVYCRVSSDDQKERDTIENQVEILRTYIEMKEDLNVYQEYLDDGVSGTVAFEQRPSGKQLILDASKGLFNTVLVWKVDRFGRDTLSGLNAVEMLRKYNIEIISVTEPFDLNTPTGRFQFITYLNMAELERNNILDRMFIGASRAAKKGKWMGGITPYGYRVNNDGYLEICEEESKIICKIFDLYVNERLSSISIALYLNNLGIPSSCGSGKGKRTKAITGKWRSTSIQRILNSTTYNGIHYYGKRSSRRKEVIEREVPSIVSEELWEQAQKVKADNVIISKRNNTARDYLLRGLIKCKNCGKVYYGISYKNKSAVYACSGKRGENKRLFGNNCNNINVNAEQIESIVWKDCVYILNNYDEYIQQFKNKSNDTDSTISAMKKLKQSFTEKKNEKNNILTLFRKNLISEEEVEEQLNDIKKEEECLADLIKGLESKMYAYAHENELINEMSNKLKYYQDRLDNLSFKEKCSVIKLLVKEIVTETVIENGSKISHFNIVYNLVKLDAHTDKD